MKQWFHYLDKAFENKIRLGLMSLLVINDDVDFNRLKESLEITDGNLASHLKNLEKLKYIEVNKEFVGRKPRTTYSATAQGREAFQKHVEALEKFLKER
ncbi:MAG: transcriptional regulator [Bacteroidota bacterium]